MWEELTSHSYKNKDFWHISKSPSLNHGYLDQENSESGPEGASLKERPGNKMEAHDATMYKQATGNSSSMGCFREAQELELVFIQWSLEVCNICSSSWLTAISFKNSQSQSLNVLF